LAQTVQLASAQIRVREARSVVCGESDGGLDWISEALGPIGTAACRVKRVALTRASREAGKLG
jgi:hypothetical protein